jgi:hypothetical protein
MRVFPLLLIMCCLMFSAGTASLNVCDQRRRAKKVCYDFFELILRVLCLMWIALTVLALFRTCS